MRKLFSALFALALLMSVSTFSAASDEAKAKKNKVVIPKAAISLTYWEGKLVKEYPASSVNSTQHYFPIIIGMYNIKGRFSVTGEYGLSGYSKVKPETAARPNLKEKASRTVVGLRYDIIPGVYAVVSRPVMELVQQDGNFRLNAGISGVQYGIGIGNYIKKPYVTAGLEFNMVPDTQIKYNTRNITSKATGESFDIKTVVYYKLPRTPNASIYAGYRYMVLDAQAAPPVVPVPVKFILSGPLAGAKYVF